MRGKRRVVIHVIGEQNDYACYTAYLWLLEMKPLILEHFKGMLEDVEVVWRDPTNEDLEKGIPAIAIDDEVVFRGLPSEAGYYLEIIVGHLRKKLMCGELY
ncbi:MAG: hypothetical protein DRN15_00605 [Thermoprotei archaeon]|nr:MAG: hypothetical protein DRM97_03115 [Thermoprotei archaeon]RLF25189.1 MAG: hypothetical protein DRN15_00605 [Thermoprotei archaeon]